MTKYLVLAVGLAACGTDLPAPKGDTLAFSITSSDLVLQPGQEVTKCFYFHTSNTDSVAIHKWVSDLTPGSHHVIMFTTLGGTPPPDGTIDDCSTSGMVPLPVYGSQVPHQEVDFPEDDGTGFPLAQDIAPNTSGYFQMHYLNGTDGPLNVHVSVSGYALPANTAYTRTDLFATYNNDISIPPHAMNYVVSATCPVTTTQQQQLAAYNFWSMSTHSHKQTFSTAVMDGNTMVVQSPDWEHPTTRTWAAPSFYTFSGALTWSCTYNNDGSNQNNTVVAGPSAQYNEMCMATGYYFPAAGPRGCFMSQGKCTCLL